MKRRWTSNIPGNPFAADSMLIASIGPFPELNDFNGISVSLPFCSSRGIMIKGRPPPQCKYWSLQFFLNVTNKNSKVFST